MAAVDDVGVLCSGTFLLYLALCLSVLTSVLISTPLNHQDKMMISVLAAFTIIHLKTVHIDGVIVSHTHTQDVFLNHICFFKASIIAAFINTTHSMSMFFSLLFCDCSLADLGITHQKVCLTRNMGQQRMLIKTLSVRKILAA